MAEKSYLNMSDEELLAQGVPDFDDAPMEAVAEETPAVVDQADEVSKDEPETKETSTEDEDKEDEKAEADSEVVDTPETELAKDTPVVEDTVDYKAEYQRLLAPFKANGKDIAIQNVDDAISLMQMGANYNKKMAGLKPNLKLMKLLENNGLLNEDRIGFLIDLEKKNPAAINKLFKDSGLDPLDLDTEKAGDYRPTSYKVDDKEMELDSVLDEIQETPTYARTLDIVSTKWDGPSKQAIASSPQLLKVINAHVQNGIYDTIATAVERERVFGRLNGLSDLDAYKQVGDAIEAQGGFNRLVQGSSQNQAKLAPSVAVAAPKSSKADEDKLREKRRAASSTKPAGPGVTKEFNPLSMPDEEFSKLVNNKYL